MQEFFKTETIQERVLLIGVRTGEADDTDGSLDELEELVKMYTDYYAEDSFVHIIDKNIDLKQVVNTNKCLIHLEKHGDKLLVISCIDNLLKGASGQAVHNMNLMFNLEETVGLRLKPSAF